MLSLAFLAPKIVEAIAAGSQPSELTAETLAERIHRQRVPISGAYLLNTPK